MTCGRPAGRWSHSQDYTNEKPYAMHWDHVYSTYFKDSAGIQMLDLGDDNVIFESDYPPSGRHQAPHPSRGCQAVRSPRPSGHRQTGRGNAIRLLGLDHQ